MTKAAKRKRSKARPMARRTKAQRGNRSSIPSGQVDTPQRRRAILIAASDLFAMHGYHGVSMRDIAQRANVPIALCAYYFGKKHELFMALFEQNSAHVKEQLAAVSSGATGPMGERAALEHLVQAWAEPAMRLRATPDGASFAILAARAVWDPAEEAKAAVEKFFDPIALAFLDALQKIYPDRDPVDLVWGYEWAIGALLMHAADHRIERLSKNRAVSGDISKMKRFVDFICAGLHSIPAKNADDPLPSKGSTSGMSLR